MAKKAMWYCYDGSAQAVSIPQVQSWYGSGKLSYVCCDLSIKLVVDHVYGYFLWLSYGYGRNLTYCLFEDECKSVCFLKILITLAQEGKKKG